ncbi:hypothetical protein [Urbifossiella limnaea]|uniref:DUF3137 domain-containing protein n=1 Tax=Urbifossiella limnaea TaxID=2528023 RepID=A0A517XRE5_9BACT|nr:hypothetical protein [Urbifossiella limnaea]QDU20098.1 hypothetical protein ETAA1_20410 [Urbifossiella limnaea]
MNDAELAAARGRITRGRIIFLFCLLMAPASFVLSCCCTLFFPPEVDLAFGLMPALVLPVVFLIAAFFARRPVKAAAAEVELIRWADENGFRYRRRAEKTAADAVYTMGGENERKYHMTGEVGGGRVEVLNRWSRSGFSEVVEVEAEQTEAALVGVLPRELDFVLLPKGEMGEVLDLTRGERLRFRDDPEFDRAFIVYSENPDSIEGGLPERFVVRCLKRPEYTVAARLGTLLVFRLNYVCTPDGYDSLLDHTLALAAALGGAGGTPRHVTT